MMKVCYLVLLAVLLGGCVVSGSVALLALLAGVVVLPLVSLVFDLLAARRLKAELQTPVNLKKGQAGEITLLLKNRTVFPVCHLRCRLRMTNRLNGETAQCNITASLLPRGTRTVTLQMENRWCGRIRVEADRFRLYDCFGLLPIPAKLNAVGSVTIQPDTFEQTILVSPDANCPDDSEVYSQERPGYDLTETFQIRDYQIGDSIRQVHWKLSNKFDRLIIRDPSLPVTRSVVVFWERAAKTNHTPQEIDAQAEVVLTACRTLTEQSVQYTLAWNDAETDLCVMQEIRDMEELIGVMPRLLAAGEKVTENSGAALFAQAAGEMICSHILYIAGDRFPGVSELERLGRVTTLLCGGEDGGVTRTFDPEQYPEQLMELEI